MATLQLFHFSDCQKGYIYIYKVVSKFHYNADHKLVQQREERRKKKKNMGVVGTDRPIQVAHSVQCKVANQNQMIQNMQIEIGNGMVPNFFVVFPISSTCEPLLADLLQKLLTYYLFKVVHKEGSLFIELSRYSNFKLYKLST